MLTNLSPRMDVTGQLAVASDKRIVVVNHSATPLPKPTDGQAKTDAAAAMQAENIGLLAYDRTVSGAANHPVLHAYLSTDIPSQIFMCKRGSHVAALTNEGKTLTIWKVDDLGGPLSGQLLEPRYVRQFCSAIDAFAFCWSGELFAVTTGKRLYVFRLTAEDAIASDDDVPSEVDSLALPDEHTVLISAKGKTRLLGIKTR